MVSLTLDGVISIDDIINAQERPKGKIICWQTRCCMSWCALISNWTMTGMTPCSRSGAWLAGDRARFRISPMTALIIGQRLGGWRSFTNTGRPPCVRTMFCAMCASAWRLVRCRSAHICYTKGKWWVRKIIIHGTTLFPFVIQPNALSQTKRSLNSNHNVHVLCTCQAWNHENHIYKIVFYRDNL